MKKIVCSIFIFICFVVVAFHFLFHFLNSENNKHAFLNGLNAISPFKISMEDIHFSYWKGISFQAKGISCRDKSAKEVVALPLVVGTISISSIFLGSPKVSLKFYRPRFIFKQKPVHVHILSPDTNGMKKILKKKPHTIKLLPLLFSFQVDLMIDSGELFYFNLDKKYTYHLKDFYLSASDLGLGTISNYVLKSYIQFPNNIFGQVFVSGKARTNLFIVTSQLIFEGIDLWDLLVTLDGQDVQVDEHFFEARNIPLPLKVVK